MQTQVPDTVTKWLPKVQQSLGPYDYGYYDDTLQRNSLYNFWSILRKRKWITIIVFFGVLLIVGVRDYLKTPIYRATALLQIIQDNTPAMIGGERDPYSHSGDPDKFYETQYTVLQSRPMALKIIDSLNLRETPPYRKLQQAMEKMKKSPEEITSAFINKFLDDLTINPLKKSYLVEFSYESPDRKMAKDVANAVYGEYVNLCMNTRQQSYSIIKDWLQNELSKLSTKVETSERKLYDYGKKKNFVAIEGEENKDNVIVKKYAELTNLLTLAQAERSKKQALYRQLAGKQPEISLISSNPLIQQLREQTISQQAKVASLSKIYDINFPLRQTEEAKLHELRSRLNNEVKRVRDGVEADYQAALKTETLLRDEVQAQKEKISILQDNLVEHHILKRDVQTNQQLYQALLARMKEASVASTMVTSNVAVIAPAELPLAPYKPNKLLDLSLGGVIGLLTGISLSFLMEYLDRSIKTNEELENICQIPSLGIVPLLSIKTKDVESRNQMQLATFVQPRSLFSEAIHQIRTSIELSDSGGKTKVILITSPNPNDGKTTIAVNLASVLATSGQRVLFIDADLRKPNGHVLFRQPLQPGLTDFLGGAASKEEIIRATFIPNLYFMPAGHMPANPMVQLNSLEFKDLMASLRKEFQHIIMDSPPIIGFADGRVISTLSDGVLLVFRHHFTTRESGRLTIQLLAQLNCHILGGVLNMAHKNKLGYGAYGEHYKYYASPHDLGLT